MFRSSNIANRPIYITEIVSTDSNGKIKKISIEKSALYYRFSEVLESDYCPIRDNGSEYLPPDEWVVGSGIDETTYNDEDLAMQDWFDTNYSLLMERDTFDTDFEQTMCVIRDWLEDSGVELSKINEIDDIYDEYEIEIELKNITAEEFMQHLK